MPGVFGRSLLFLPPFLLFLFVHILRYPFAPGPLCVVEHLQFGLGRFIRRHIRDRAQHVCQFVESLSFFANPRTSLTVATSRANQEGDAETAEKFFRHGGTPRLWPEKKRK